MVVVHIHGWTAPHRKQVKIKLFCFHFVTPSLEIPKEDLTEEKKSYVYSQIVLCLLTDSYLHNIENIDSRIESYLDTSAAVIKLLKKINIVPSISGWVLGTGNDSPYFHEKDEYKMKSIV